MVIQSGQTLLVLGGARSGKSAHGEAVAMSTGLRLQYIATAQAGDDEMAARIATHKARRGPDWHTNEVTTDLAAALDTLNDTGSVVLVDCLTLWLSNLMAENADIETATDTLGAALARARGAVILISNEVGGGIVPDNALARAFRDAQGRLNQRLAQISDKVDLVTAGLPMVLKSPDTGSNKQGNSVHG